MTNLIIPPAETLLVTAHRYVGAGLSVIPILADGTKRPDCRQMYAEDSDTTGRGWKKYQYRRATSEELDRMFFRLFGPSAPPQGIAVVCGDVSGNLEVIDVDDPNLVEAWLNLLRKKCPETLRKLTIVRTPRPGLHCYYRCDEISPSCKLAMSWTSSGIPGASPKASTLIETRGEGGYAIIPPSHSLCHPTGQFYTYFTPGTLADVCRITPDERRRLFDLAKRFGVDPPAKTVRKKRYQPNDGASRVSRTRRPPSDRRRPGDDFEAQTTWTELLEKYGWALERCDADGTEHWRRPGKSVGTSATVNFAEAALLHVFSTNVPELESDQSYSRFAFYTHMEHGGDFNAAARALRTLGYGRPLRLTRPRLRHGSARRSRRRRA